MKKLFLFLPALLNVPSNGIAGSVHWGYNGSEAPENWGQLSSEYRLCSAGKNQAPVNIDEVIGAKLPPILINYSVRNPTIANNGHTILIEAEQLGYVDANGKSFRLKQFHFHTPSENHIHGQSFPMEAHFVHQDKNGTLLVIAVMFEEGEANPILSLFLPHLSAQKNSVQRLPESIDLKQLLPADLSYYRFNGSLTTPPCTEGVGWFVLKRPISASAQQLEAFAAAMGERSNRPTQPLNARVIVG